MLGSHQWKSILFIKFKLPVCFVVYLGTGAQSACKYRRFGGRVTWQQAKVKCKQKGKRLARITNTNDLNDAADTSCVIGVSSDQKYWIGLKLDSSGERFTWSDASDNFPISALRDLFQGSPHFDTGQPCCHMYIGPQGNHYLQMGSCQETLGYICENPHGTCKYCMYVLCLCLCRFVDMFVCMNVCTWIVYRRVWMGLAVNWEMGKFLSDNW